MAAVGGARLERNVLPDGRSYAERDDFVVGIPVGAGTNFIGSSRWSESACEFLEAEAAVDR